jgi:hypothetical protein
MVFKHDGQTIVIFRLIDQILDGGRAIRGVSSGLFHPPTLTPALQIIKRKYMLLTGGYPRCHPDVAWLAALPRQWSRASFGGEEANE